MISLLLSFAFADPLPDPPCPATIAALPPSPLYDADDARWRGEGAVVVVLKERRLGMVYRAGVLAKTADGSPACWPVALASGYVPGHKQRRGDLRTPEGWYRTSDRPWSAFSHALTVHYPTPADAERGLEAGLISTEQHAGIVAAAARDRAPPMETRLGGRILLHGGGSRPDWTLGCVGFDDPDIVALRALIPASMRADLLIPALIPRRSRAASGPCRAGVPFPRSGGASCGWWDRPWRGGRS